MKIITSPMTWLYNDREDIQIPPETPVVVPDWNVASLAAALRPHSNHPRVSGMGHYTRPYFGQDLNGKRLYAKRGCGVGDQMIFAGMLQILKQRYPDAEIDFCVAPQLWEALWSDMDPDALGFRFIAEPTLFSDFREYDYHLIGEFLCEADAEPDQPDIWTGHLQFAGIDPASVPQERRKPVVPRSHAGDMQAAALMRDVRVRHGFSAPVILWQLAASSRIRSYRPDLTRRALDLIRTEIPEAVIIITGTDEQITRYEIDLDGNMLTTAGCDLRAVCALIANRVDVVVCPDSCLGHVCGRYDTPCVSLWSSFLPTDRVGSYSSHRPVTGEIECSPCRCHQRGRIDQGCPLTGEDPHANPYCAGLANITPEEIVSNVMEALS